jgi:hypothetical protein
MLSRSASCVFFVLLLFPPSPTRAIVPDHISQVDLDNPVVLQEATRVLAEEIKLAARPQTYIIVDLVDRAVLIKGRGIELHRFPIEQWSAVQLGEASSVFRLQARPPVARRKIEPAAGVEQPPVSLDDMPTVFTLTFAPPFALTVQPSASDNVWRWLRFYMREWWSWLQEWILTLATGKGPVRQPLLQLTVTAHHAQSLAWTVTEGMPVLVRRSSASD